MEQPSLSTPSNATILVHGGCGNVYPRPMAPERRAAYEATLLQAAQAGFEVLQAGKSSVEAVEVSIKVLEDSPLFNAAHGAVFSNDGGVELDASIMDGAAFLAGAVAGVKTIRNPISAARQVMEASAHVMLVGTGAEAFAETVGLELVSPAYFETEERRAQIRQVKEAEAQGHPFQETKLGTVGAVALDQHGKLAAGTSTGGMLNKRFGRVGDSPIIGAGTYANHICAVSGTGHGEFFMRHTVAHDIAALMEYKGLTVEQAVQEVIHGKVHQAGGQGGVIVLDVHGNPGITYSTQGMFWARISPDGAQQVHVDNLVIE
ncbi:isoaspartyl peptidase/L-asparaginase family protein [Rufibacter glacialis]|uniref:Isoaspartyl peptidase n=1 Tax=Rufibacter glacialis TaxID=1259555 RepID=A0A5M8Q7D7_9BACT|nr:isoaspartyl peptidase/L-asparaginase [Rufibacter glacialis]KAA6430786.1 isoaspartyl peptidase/L-asparaginase [Rufibacter glacialis]GGK86709.1 isoaspartyl peptidase/L-asparaginase [Rufibacter glacialis]